MTRLFVAVRPPEDVRAVLEDLPRAAEPGVRWVPPHQWHITLRFLGEVPDGGDVGPGIVDDVRSALAGVVGGGALGGRADEHDSVELAVGESPVGELPVGEPPGVEPPMVELGPVVSRLGRSVVVVPARGLDPLADAVTAATSHLGEPPDPRGFHGHLTLARLKGRAACGVTGAAVSASFDVEEIELVASQTLPEGAVHEVIGRYRLHRAENVDPNA